MSATADIQKFSRNSEGHTQYFIKVVFQGRQWAIRKRYSEFILFDEFLQKSGYKVNYSLPEKTWWKRFDPQVLVLRQKELQLYLNTLLSSTVSTENSLVREFLEVDQNRLAAAKRQTVREFKYSENLDAIVLTFPSLMIDIPSNKSTAAATTTPSKNRQMSSVFQRMNSLGTGFRTISNAKSTSFSQRPMLRRGETVTSDSGGGGASSYMAPMTPIGRERRFSVDIFNQMVASSPRPSSGSYSRSFGELNDFTRSVTALWVHYEPPISQEIEDMEMGGDFPVSGVACTAEESLSSGLVNVLNEPTPQQTEARTSLEAELERLVAEVPFYINDILKSHNPVFLAFTGPSPTLPGCSMSSSVYTDVPDSLSEAGSRNNSTTNSSSAHKQVNEEADEDEEDEEAGAVGAASSGSGKTDLRKAMTPSTSLESLAR